MGAKGIQLSEKYDIGRIDFCPGNAAYGAVIEGLHEKARVGTYKGLENLKTLIAHDRKAKLGERAGAPQVKSLEELQEFRRQYSIPKFIPASF